MPSADERAVVGRVERANERGSRLSSLERTKPTVLPTSNSAPPLRAASSVRTSDRAAVPSGAVRRPTAASEGFSFVVKFDGDQPTERDGRQPKPERDGPQPKPDLPQQQVKHRSN